MRKTFGICALWSLGMLVFAEGYQVNLQGARQTGMGHTGTGLSFGATSIHFNPGALALMKKDFDFSLGGSAIFSSNVFQKQYPSVYEAKSDNPLGTPVYAYAAGRVTDKLVLGLGITTPYGNSLKWGDDWDGRYLIQDISLQAIYFQPTASFILSDHLSIGAGFVYATGDVTLHKALHLQGDSGDGQAELKGSTHNYGYNVGVFFKPNESFSVGVDYRSQITMKMDEGEAKFTVPSSLSTTFPNTTFEASLPMPANLVVGIGFSPNEKLLLAADLQYVFWSAYDELSFDFEEESVPDSKNIRNYENTLVYRLGAEYKITDNLTCRAGLAYDATPIPTGLLTPETPGANKLNFSAGLSYAFGKNLSIDASFLYIRALERNDGYEPAGFYGTYNTHALIPGFGLNYSF